MQKYLREFIELIIKENVKFLTNTAKELAIAKACEKLGIEIIMNSGKPSVKCYGSASKKGGGEHCRIQLTGKNAYDKSQMAADIIKQVLGVNDVEVSMPGKTRSGTFETYQVTVISTGETYDLLFGGGLKGGQRGGGYAYEGEIKEKLRNAGANFPQEGAIDTTVTDIFVETARGTEIGIEVKAEGAKFGQPTLQFSYDSYDSYDKSKSKSKFYAKRTKSIETAKLVLTILNDQSKPERNEIIDWLNSLISAWDSLHPEQKMLEWDSQVQVADWKLMKSTSKIKQSGPSISIDINEIITYYLKKQAHYIQFKGKGLYALKDVLRLGPRVPILGGVATIRPEILNSGGNMVIRASLELTGLSESTFDLDNDKDARAFAIALSKN